MDAPRDDPEWEDWLRDFEDPEDALESYLLAVLRESWPEREILVAEEIREAFSDNLLWLFGDEGWSDPGSIAHTLVRYRDEFRDPVEVIESWAPTKMLPLATLTECDDERVLERIPRIAGERHQAIRAYETIWIRRPEDEAASLLEIFDSVPLARVARTYYDREGRALLHQLTTLAPGVFLSYNRNLIWEHKLRTPSW